MTAVLVRAAFLYDLRQPVVVLPLPEHFGREERPQVVFGIGHFLKFELPLHMPPPMRASFAARTHAECPALGTQ